MTQAGKVAEIFSVAGEAFTQLGNLAMCLQPASTQDGGKWEDEEIDMLRKAVAQFGNDIEKISEKIKTKSTVQIKNTLKRKAVQNLNVNPTIRSTNVTKPASVSQTQNDGMKSSSLTPTSQVPNSSPKTLGATHVMPYAAAPQGTVNITTTPASAPTVVYVTTIPPGLKPIAAKPSIMPSNMKPTVMAFQGQNIAVKANAGSISSQQQNINIRPPLMSGVGQNLNMKSTGVASPASIITSQLNKSPMKIINMPRTVGQKTKLDNVSVSGMMSLADVHNASKKVKVDSANLNILTSTLLSQKPLIRSQTPGIPGVVSSQGFQVLMPSSSKNIYPISVRPTSGVVQRVADANPVTGNIDVES